MTHQNKPLFPYFGNKRRVNPVIWRAFAISSNYVEREHLMTKSTRDEAPEQRAKGGSSSADLIAQARDDLEDRGVIDPPRALRRDELSLLKSDEDS